MPDPGDPNIIAGQLCSFVRTHLVAGSVTVEADSKLADLGIDSFTLVELLLFAERTFGVAVPESHLTREHLLSLSSLAQCIAGLRQHKSSTPTAP